VAGHLKSNCPDLAQVNAVSGGDVPKIHPYLKVAVINGREYSALLDTGSSCTLLKSTVAVRSGLGIRPSEKRLFGVGSTVIPSLESVGESTIEVIIDGVNAGPIVVLVVPDGAQGPDVIIGRNWLDSSTVTYRKAGNDLIIKKVSSVNDLKSLW